MKKVIITGASGMLGAAFRQQFALEGNEVVAWSRNDAWEAIKNNNTEPFCNASLLIHAAANTDVEHCEKNPDECYRDNYFLTARIAAKCDLTGTPLVYISSTGVYGAAQTTPYREYSKVQPTTHHHRAKLLGEEAVLVASKKNLVVRTGWLFGGSFLSPKNFVARRIEEGLKNISLGQSVYSNNEQWGCPTFTQDVVERVKELINKRLAGVFNVVNEGCASRFEYVKAIIEIAGIDISVQPISAKTFNRIAKVSDNEMAINWRSKVEGLEDMPIWKDSLRKYIEGQRGN